MAVIRKDHYLIQGDFVAQKLGIEPRKAIIEMHVECAIADRFECAVDFLHITWNSHGFYHTLNQGQVKGGEEEGNQRYVKGEEEEDEKDE